MDNNTDYTSQPEVATQHDVCVDFGANNRTEVAWFTVSWMDSSECLQARQYIASEDANLVYGQPRSSSNSWGPDGSLEFFPQPVMGF